MKALANLLEKIWSQLGDMGRDLGVNFAIGWKAGRRYVLGFIEVCFEAEPLKALTNLLEKIWSLTYDMDRFLIAEDNNLTRVHHCVISAPVQFGTESVPADKPFYIAQTAAHYAPSLR